MRKFIYRMQGILDIKYKLEEQAKAHYGAARARLIEAEEVLGQLLARQEGYRAVLKDMMNDTLKIKEILSMHKAEDFMKDMIQIQRQKIKREEQLVEIARLRLNEAAVERKTQEKLKENAFDAYKLEFEAEERKEIDELVSYQYTTKTGNF